MNIRWCAVICLLFGLTAPDASGCRYSVRDAGFVDLGASTYRLYLFSDEESKDRLPSSIRTFAALADSNIRSETIDTGGRERHPAMKYLELLNITSIPAAVLVSPEGRPMALTLSGKGASERESTWAMLDGLVSSPLRGEILENILEAFCVVLLVEGDQAEANDRALEEAQKAVERVTGMMWLMPKPVKEPPHLIRVPYEKIPEEKVLLWSLGIDAKDTAEPHVIVLYGRGRRIGPLLRGGTIKEKFLFNILLIIGADCECDLDRAWLQGKMIPLRWSEAVQAKAAAVLDFDPENPMVKMEVSRIISSGPGGRYAAGGFDDPLEEDVLFGYSEEAVTFEPAEPEEQAASGEQALPLENATESTPEPENPKAQEEAAPYYATIAVVVGLAVLMLAGALFIVLRSNTRAR
jgi:hypothetical protein